jgi:two-component system OmpR family sensor kinase
VWRGAPLWSKLIAGLLAVTALALVLNGLVSERLVRTYLVDRLDADLVAAARPLADDPPEPTPDSRPVDLPSPYYVSLVSPAGRVVDEHWTPPDADDPAPALPSLTLADTKALDGKPFTVAGWRVVARPLGERAGSVVVARSLDDTNATISRVSTVGLITAIALLGALAAGAYLVVRRLLAPLPGIEHAALAVLEDGDLGARAPEPDRRTELGRVGRAFNAMTDELAAARDSEERAVAVALQADRRVTSFVADASRELRRPLNSLRDLVDLSRHSALTEPAALHDLIDRIEQEARQMGLLVDDLLLLTRIDQQRPLGNEPVDLVAAARDAADAARVVALDRAIMFVAADEPVVVVGDEMRLRHVATNLVDNAVAHTPPGTPVEIEIGRARRDGRAWAELEVRDRGPGLSPDQAERVFDRFYRTDQARQRSGGTGSGLGLAIVDAIVTAHGGIAEVDTSSSRGAVFRVLLPLHDNGDREPRSLLPARLH